MSTSHQPCIMPSRSTSRIANVSSDNVMANEFEDDDEVNPSMRYVRRVLVSRDDDDN